MPYQRDWMWCNKCQVLWFTGRGPAACQAGGNHDSSWSSNYTLWHEPPPPPKGFTVQTAPGQFNWMWCNKCQALCYGGNTRIGNCPVGGAHDHSGSGYYSIGTGQSDWKWCNKCQALSFAGNPNPGPCPDGGVHDHTGSRNYTLLFKFLSAYVALPFQADWRWCNKCQVLCINPGGACQAGGVHDFGGSENYVLFGSPQWVIQNDLAIDTSYQPPDPPAEFVPGQGKWAWCGRCHELLFYGNPHKGTCPAGGGHSFPAFSEYGQGLQYWIGSGQSDWKWCNKCQALSFAGNPNAGPCPDGGVHDHGGSSDYTLLFAP
jgi:hypothetical protein